MRVGREHGSFRFTCPRSSGALYFWNLIDGGNSLSTLTPKQEKFAQLYVELGNASEAYRLAYNSKAKAESVNVNASKLLAGAKVSLRVQELRDDLEEKSLWKRLDSIKTLASIADGTDPEAKPSDRVNAVKALNTMHGWDAPSKLDVTTKGESLNRPASELSDDELAAIAAASNKAE